MLFTRGGVDVTTKKQGMRCVKSQHFKILKNNASVSKLPLNFESRKKNRKEKLMNSVINNVILKLPIIIYAQVHYI